jgi:hypothetical protein
MLEELEILGELGENLHGLVQVPRLLVQEGFLLDAVPERFGPLFGAADELGDLLEPAGLVRPALGGFRLGQESGVGIGKSGRALAFPEPAGPVVDHADAPPELLLRIILRFRSRRRDRLRGRLRCRLRHRLRGRLWRRRRFHGTGRLRSFRAPRIILPQTTRE